MWCAAVHSIIFIKSRTFWRPSSLRYGIPLSSFSIVSIRHVRLQNTGGFCFRRIVFRQASGGQGVPGECQLLRQVSRSGGTVLTSESTSVHAPEYTSVYIAPTSISDFAVLT